MKSKIYKKIVYALAKIAVKRMSNRTAEYQLEEKADDNSEIIDLNTDESMDCINSIDRIDGEKAEGDTAINEEKTVEPTGEERLDMLLRGITVDQQTEIMQQEITGKQTESIQQVDSIQQTDDDKKPDSLQEKQEPQDRDHGCCGRCSGDGPVQCAVQLLHHLSGLCAVLSHAAGSHPRHVPGHPALGRQPHQVPRHLQHALHAGQGPAGCSALHGDL